MARRPLAHLLLRHAYAELRRLRRIRGAHRHTRRRLAAAQALGALAATLLAPAVESAALPRFVNPRDFFGFGAVDRFSRPALGDLDGDGDLDLLVGTRYSGFFHAENTGTETEPAFAAPVQNAFGLVASGAYDTPALGDLDSDGDLDLLAGDQSGALTFFRNTASAAAPAFAAPVAPAFGATSVPAFSSPALGDLDGDGDLDLLVGEDDSNLHYFANTGTAQAPAFAAAVLNPFGIVSNALEANPACADLDGDGDLDLFLGGENGYTHLYRNTGTASVAAFADQTGLVGLPYQGGNAAPAVVDLDGDGDLDVVRGEYHGSLFFHENTTGGASPEFAPLATNPLNLAEFPSQAAPALGDLDDSGAVDLLIGDANGSSHLQVNGGTATSPLFNAPQANVLGLADVGSTAVPALVDLDGDGDLDVVFGEYDGNLVYFQNTGIAASPVFAAPVANPFGLANLGFGSEPRPAFADLDSDGDLDGMVASGGIPRLFANIGSATAPAFFFVQTLPFSITGVDFIHALAFADLDGDRDLDMIAGEPSGEVTFLEEVGEAPLYGEWEAFASRFGHVALASGAVPALADVDGDTDLDLFVGSTNGFTAFFRNAGVDCPPAPVVECAPVAKATLAINERKAGKESLAIALSKGPALAQADFGDARRTSGTGVGICLYDDADVRVAALAVEAAGEACGTKPCWRPIGGEPPDGKGWKYKDAVGAADGVRSLDVKGGAAGKSKIAAKASNNAAKGQTGLPTGIAAALEGTASVTVQVRTSEDGCFGATLADVKKATATQLKATLP